MKTRHKGPRCGHSACSQHYIDTGCRDCILDQFVEMRLPLGCYVEHDARPANVVEICRGERAGHVVIEYAAGGRETVDADHLRSHFGT